MRHKKSDKDREIEENYIVFQEQLSNLIAQYGRGKFMLIRHKEFIQVFDTKEDALKAAVLLYKDEIFSVQEINDMIIDLGFYSHTTCQQ